MIAPCDCKNGIIFAESVHESVAVNVASPWLLLMSRCAFLSAESRFTVLIIVDKGRDESRDENMSKDGYCAMGAKQRDCAESIGAVFRNSFLGISS